MPEIFLLGVVIIAPPLRLPPLLILHRAGLPSIFTWRHDQVQIPRLTARLLTRGGPGDLWLSFHP